MNIDDVIIDKKYRIKLGTTYIFSVYDEDINIVQNKNSYDEAYAYEKIKPFTKKGITFNIRMSLEWICIYTNSYYLEEITPNKNNDKVDCIEVRNGKPIFDKQKQYEEELRLEFNLAKEEEWESTDRIKNDWNKEIIHMKLDKALENVSENKEELIRLSEKLKEIR